MAIARQVGHSLGPDDYLQQLQQLLPYGPAWTDDPDAAITKLLTGLSQELARVDARAWQLIDEADPRTTHELLPDWERVAGLPDPCVAARVSDQTLAQRVAALVAKLVQVGGQSVGYFKAIALALGYTIEITLQPPPFRTGWNFCTDRLGTADSVYWWHVTALIDSLSPWRNAVLECTLRALAPAHTLVTFDWLDNDLITEDGDPLITDALDALDLLLYE